MSRRDRQRRRRRNRGSALARVMALGGVLVLCAAIVGALAITGWVVNVAHSAPNLSSIHPTTPGSPSEVFAADGTPLGYIYAPQIHTPVKGKAFPHLLRRATIDVEDRRFYQHGALDYQGILRAALKDAVNGKTALQGASTLTMQLVDNRYLPKKYTSARAKRDLKYKIVQAKLAEQLEAKHSKRWILYSYLNNVPYGTLFNQTAYGAGAAAQMFFSRPVSKLDLAQAALLAGLPQAPSSYNPFLDPKAARERRAHVLQSMVRAGDISQHRANTVGRGPLQIKANREFQRRVDPYVFDFIEQQVTSDLCPGQTRTRNCPIIQHGGLKIYTSIDLAKQAAATASIRNNASTMESAGGPGTGAGVASIEAATGHIQAIATSGYYNQTKVNYATSASRQTGSAFKVFALMELIHDYHGNPNSTFYTSKPLPAGWNPLDPSWSVHTDDNVYNGTIDISEATAISDNTVFAQMAEDLGYTKLDAMAHAMGITSQLNGNPSEVLGGLTDGTTPLQMADAYATIADGGVHHPPTIIGKVVFQDGSSRDFGHPKATRVFTYGETYEADTVLKAVITQAGATGTAANYGCPAAGKTGTAENLANAWFVGYTPRISTAVWVGHPIANVAMPDGFGGVLAAPIWKDYMESTDGGYCGDWTPPSVPFEGTAYFGPNSASGSTSSLPTTTGTSTGVDTTTDTAPTTDTTSQSSTTPAGATPPAQNPPAGSPPSPGGTPPSPGGNPPSPGGVSTTGGGGLPQG